MALPTDYFDNYADNIGEDEDRSYQANWRDYGFHLFERYLNMLEKMYLKYPKNILEIGSADGSVMRELQSQGFDVRGIESNFDMYKLAGSERSRITYGDAVQVLKAIPDGSFDCIFETAAQYIEEKTLRSYFKNIHRITRRDLIITLHTFEEGSKPHPYQKNHQSRDWWLELLESVGFEDVSKSKTHLYWLRKQRA